MNSVLRIRSGVVILKHNVMRLGKSLCMAVKTLF